MTDPAQTPENFADDPRIGLGLAQLTDHELDEHLAVAAARRDAAATHGRDRLAAHWNGVAVAMAEHRDRRRAVLRDLAG